MKSIWGVTFGLLVCIQTGHAQNIENVNTALLLGEFNESFDNRAKVSGTPLAGVKLVGPLAERFQTAKFVLLPEGQDTEVCVESKTRDGRYSSLNRYTVQDSGLGLIPTKIEPTTVKYKSELSSYVDADFALLTSLRTDQHCSLKDAVIFPRVTSTNWTRSVILEVNSRSRSASIETHDHQGTLIDSTCKNIDVGANIAFDKRCTLDLSSADQELFDINLKLDDGFGEEVHEFRIYIPQKMQWIQP